MYILYFTILWLKLDSSSACISLPGTTITVAIMLSKMKSKIVDQDGGSNMSDLTVKLLFDAMVT